MKKLNTICPFLNQIHNCPFNQNYFFKDNLNIPSYCYYLNSNNCTNPYILEVIEIFINIFKCNNINFDIKIQQHFLFTNEIWILIKVNKKDKKDAEKIYEDIYEKYILSDDFDFDLYIRGKIKIKII